MIDLVSVIPAKTRRDTKWKMAYQVEIFELEKHWKAAVQMWSSEWVQATRTALIKLVRKVMHLCRLAQMTSCLIFGAQIHPLENENKALRAENDELRFAMKQLINQLVLQVAELSPHTISCVIFKLSLLSWQVLVNQIVYIN